MLESFRHRFSFEKWFDSWRDELDRPSSVRRLVLEALSDSSAEQFLNPLVASSLRGWGARLAAEAAPERTFWVRSEWEKVDLSYGLAEPFPSTTWGWNAAWMQGKTGDLGQCEVKVCYTHLYAGKLRTLAGQLACRRDRDRDRHAPAFETLRYYGIVWLFEHGGTLDLESVGAALESEATELGLTVCRPFRYPTVPDQLGRIWPSVDFSPYQCGMSISLLELTTK